MSWSGAVASSATIPDRVPALAATQRRAQPEALGWALAAILLTGCLLVIAATPDAHWPESPGMRATLAIAYAGVPAAVSLVRAPAGLVIATAAPTILAIGCAFADRHALLCIAVAAIGLAATALYGPGDVEAPLARALLLLPVLLVLGINEAGLDVRDAGLAVAAGLLVFALSRSVRPATDEPAEEPSEPPVPARVDVDDVDERDDEPDRDDDPPTPAPARFGRAPAQSAQATGALPRTYFSYVAPRVVDASELNGWETRGASVVGAAHVHQRRPRQDSFAVATSASDRYLVIAVGDGVSAARHSHIGAEGLTRLVAHQASALLDRDGALGYDDAKRLAAEASQLLVQQLSQVVVDPEPADFATTLILAHVDTTTGECGGFRVGDSCSWLIDGPASRSLYDTTKDANGVVSSATAALPTTEPAVEMQPRVCLTSGQKLMVATDGIGDPMTQSTPFRDDFARRLDEPIQPDAFLSLTSFERRGANDDRTAVVVWPPMRV